MPISVRLPEEMEQRLECRETVKEYEKKDYERVFSE